MTVAEAGKTATWANAPVEGDVDTVDEAVKAWLNQKGDVDLENLSKADLDQLIRYLSSLPNSAFKNSAEFKSLFADLKTLQKDWPASSGTDSLEVLRNGLEAKENFLSELAAATEGSDSLDGAIASTNAVLAEVVLVNDWLNSPTEGLKGNPSAEMAEVRNAIQSLREMGFSEAQLGGMGLLGVEKALIEADQEYQSILSSDNKNKAELADSSLREVVANIKIAHAARMGMEPDDDFIKQQRGVIENENIWQTNLTAAWEDYKVPSFDIEEYTPEKLMEYREHLKKQLDLIPPGPEAETARKLIEAKIEVTSSSIKEFPVTDSGKVSAAMGFAIDLRVVDRTAKYALLQEAKNADNPDPALISKLEQEIALIDSIVATITDMMSKLLEAMQNSYNQTTQV